MVEHLLWLLRYTGCVLSVQSETFFSLNKGFVFKNIDQCVLTSLLMINIKISNLISLLGDRSAVEYLCYNCALINSLVISVDCDLGLIHTWGNIFQLKHKIQ